MTLFAILTIAALSATDAPPVPTPQSALRNPLFAFCMDTHDAKRRTLEQQAAMLRELGYAGAGHLWLDHLAERLQTLDAAGLALFQVYVRVDLSKPDAPYDPRLRESLALLKGRDTMLALLMGGGRPSDTALDDAAVRIVREIADRAREYNLHVVLYPHSGEWLERVEDGLRVIEKADRPNVGVMFNLCHWLKVDNEENLAPLLAKAVPHLYAVSFHGADRAADIHAGTGNWIQPLDSGTFDLKGFLKMLRDLGYQGPIGLQCYGIEGDAAAHLKRSMDAWKKLVQE